MADESNYNIVGEEEYTGPKYDIQGIKGETQEKPEMDDYATVFKEMTDHGFSDEQKTYVLQNMKAKKDYEAKIKADRARQKAAWDADQKKKQEELALKEKTEKEAAELKEKEKVDSLDYTDPIDKRNFKTLVAKDEDDVIAHYNKLRDSDSNSPFYGLDITFETSNTIGNMIDIHGPGFEGMQIDLRPFTQKGKDLAENQFKSLQAWAETKKGDVLENGASLNLLSGKDTSGELGSNYFDQDDIDSANETYKEIGMEIVPGRMYQGDMPYDVKRDGEVVASFTNVFDLENYLGNRDNFTEEDKEHFNSEHVLHQEQEEKNKSELMKNPANHANAEQVKFNYKQGPQAQNDIKILYEGVSDEGMETINAHLNTPIVSKDGEYEPVENWQAQRFDQVFTDEVRDKLSPEDQLIFDQAKAKSEEVDDDGKTLFDRSIEKQQVYDNEKIVNSVLAKQYREDPNRAFVRYSSRQKSIDLEKDRQVIEENLNTVADTYKKDSDNTFVYSNEVIQNAALNGVKLETKKDKAGNNIYIAKGDDPTKVAEYQKKFNEIKRQEELNKSKYRTAKEKEMQRYLLWKKANQDNDKMVDISGRETDLSNIMLNEFNDAVSSIGYSVPALFGNEMAINMQQSRGAGKESYEAALDWNTAAATGQKGRYGMISLAQQAPNIMLAIATQGIGTSLGASTTVASALTSTAFGINSGGSKRADLTIQKNSGIEAQERLDELELNKDYMPYADYVNAKAGLEEQIAMGDMTTGQIIGQSVVSGVIEGGVAFALGTVPNSAKLMKGIISGPGDDMVNAVVRKNLHYYGAAGLEFGKRTMGEVLEESIIHFGDAASESLILGREANFDGWEDVIASSIITGGVMNGPGIAYTSVMNRMKTSDLRAQWNNSNDKINGYKKDLTNPAISPMEKSILRNQIGEEFSKQVVMQNDMEVGAMLLGADGTRRLMENGIVLDELHQQADVIPGDSQDVIDKKVKQYSESLKGEEKSNYDNRLDRAVENTNNLLNSINYKDGYRVWGDRGELLNQKLMATDPNYKAMNDKQKASFIHQTIKGQIDQQMIDQAKADPSIKAMVESQLYPDGKPKGRPSKANLEMEREAYLGLGRLLGGMKAQAISTNQKQKLNAESVLGNKRLKNITTVQVSDRGFEYDIRKMEQNGQLADGENADDIISSIKKGETFGAIVGNKYIVTDVKAAAANLVEGKLMQGTVFSHEVKHAVDNLAFNPEEMAEYSNNLRQWIEKESPSIHAEALTLLQGNNHFIPGVDWKSQPDIVHREYGNYVQDALQRDQYKSVRDKLDKAKASVRNVIGEAVSTLPFINTDYKVNTPNNAAKYLADHMKAFDKGDMSKIAEMRADKRKGLINPDTGTLRSSDLQGILNENYKGENSTKADVKSLVDTLLNNDFNGEPMIGGSDQLSAFDFHVGGILESITRRLYDKIPMNQRGVLTRAEYKASLKTEAVNLLQQEYDPTLQDMDTFLSNRLNLRANSLATELGVTSDFMLDIDNVTDVLTDDTSDDINLDDNGNEIANETDFSDGLKFTPTALSTILDHVKLNLGGVLPSISAEKGKNATVSPLVSELKKLFYSEKNPIQQEIEKIMGDTPVKVEMWLKDPLNKALILKHMPTTWLARNMPKAVQKLVIQEDGSKKWTTDHVGRTKGTKPGQVDFYRSTEVGPYKGMTDGKQKIRRNPKAMTEVSSIDIIKKFFNGKSMTDLRRGGLDTLTRAMAQEIGLEQFRADVANNGELAKMFASRQELLHGEIADNMVAQVIDQVERGAVLKSEGNLGAQFYFDQGFDADILGRMVRLGYEQGVDSKIFRDKLSEIDSQMPGASFLIELILEDLSSDNITKDNIGFLSQIRNNPNIPQALKDQIKNKEHLLRGKDGKVNDAAYNLNKEVKNILSKYGIDKGMIDALGGDLQIFGYINRAMDAAKNSKKYKGNAPFYADKIAIYNGLKNMTTGFNPKDILVANKKNTALRNMYAPLLHSTDSNEAKDLHLESIRDRINAANISNIGHLKHIMDTLNKAFQDKNLSPLALTQLMQIQTNIVTGIRGLSGIEYFMYGNFIDNATFKNISPEVEINSDAYNNWLSQLKTYDFYQERYDINKAEFSKNPDLTDSQVERATNDATYKDLLIKGEHIGAQANTSADLMTAILDGTYNDDTFARITEDHTQFFGPNFVMDMLDDTLGQTSRDSHLRITRSLEGRLDILNRVKHISGKPAVEAIAAKQVIFNSKGDLDNAKIMENAIKQKYMNNPTRGITVLDFDDTLATTKSKVIGIAPDGTTISLNAEQYASQYEALNDLGYKWDFSQFDKVISPKLAPLFQKALKLQKKFGPDNMFILTARPAEAKVAIHAFLQANNLKIPIDNIVGLGNSTSDAKAMWIAEKVGEGYNDFYFADDALQNVQAVKNMLDQFDVKSKVQQARILRSSDSSSTLNTMIARSLGVAEYKEYSEAKAKLAGKNKGKWKFFVAPGAEDFKGLLYPLLGKGVQGDADMKFFRDKLIDPFSRGVDQINMMAQALSTDYKALNKAMPDQKKRLRKKIPGSEFTYDQAVRVYLWEKSGIEIPGLSKTDKAKMVKAIQSDPSMVEYANNLAKVVKSPTYINPDNGWLASTIAKDLYSITQGEGRKQALAEFIQNRKEMFGDWKNGKLDGPLMNKLEATLGTNWRDAMEDMLWRMENGTNRAFGKNKLTNRFANWVNNSVGAIMFFNGRSAVLQTLSAANYINWSDNNPIAAAKAFANQKQYWKDFSMIFNSDMLKQRRSGNKRSVSESEIAQIAATSDNPSGAILQKLLDFGFLPTQIADSFAIAMGGASMLRNRINTYLKDGMTQVDAEAKAWTDFQKITEESQQSSRPDMISSQQASPLGRLLLAFQNTPMQYTRLTKKAILDLKNGRGDAKTNISKIIYYAAVQNMIFGALQKAMFRFMFEDDEEDEEKRKATVKLANGMVDSFLRGTGVSGAILATLKNMIMKFIEQDKKGYNFSESAIMVELLNLSPPIGSKLRKIRTGFQTYKFRRKEIGHMNTWDIDNPIWSTTTQTISALTNIPADRVYQKIMNLRESANSDNEIWQRIALLIGYPTWDLNVENAEVKQARDEVIEINKQEKKAEKDKEKKEKEKERKEREAKMVHCSAHIRKGKGPRCKNLTENKNGKCYAHQ